MTEHYEVIIIGAGIQGLCAAHTFLSINPSLSLLVIDNEASLGGTWTKRKIFPGLRANNLQGYFEFSDFPMLEADVGVTPRGLVSGEAFTSYLQKYAERFDLLPHIQFNTRVLQAVNSDDPVKSWTLQLAGVGQQADQKEQTVTCSKLLSATGQASQPQTPVYPGLENCHIPKVHTSNLGTAGTDIIENADITRVTIIGGGKSSYDAVYRFASAGKRVTWLIRRSGRGGMWLAKSFPQLGPFSVWLEHLLMARPLSWFGAAPWSEGDGFGGARHFLHNTSPGRWLTRNYFANMSKSTLDQSGIETREKTKKLVPKESLMWYGGQASILNYPKDFYELVDEAGVEIVCEDIKHFENDTVILENGQKIVSDAIIYATGYKSGPSFSILPASKHASWGVPMSTSSPESTVYASLDTRADAELFQRFPYLKQSPTYPERDASQTPWRLWRFIAPPSQVVAEEAHSTNARNLAFLTNVETYENLLKAELVALWSYAYLYNELTTQPASEQEVMYEATLWSRFGKWRCPMGSQGKTGDTLHDNMPYYDTLVRDLGLNSWRKGWGLLGEIFGGSYEVKDYKGLVQEWCASRGLKMGR